MKLSLDSPKMCFSLQIDTINPVHNKYATSATITNTNEKMLSFDYSNLNSPASTTKKQIARELLLKLSDCRKESRIGFINTALCKLDALADNNDSDYESLPVSPTASGYQRAEKTLNISAKKEFHTVFSLGVRHNLNALSTKFRHFAENDSENRCEKSARMLDTEKLKSPDDAYQSNSNGYSRRDSINATLNAIVHKLGAINEVRLPNYSHSASRERSNRKLELIQERLKKIPSDVSLEKRKMAFSEPLRQPVAKKGKPFTNAQESQRQQSLDRESINCQLALIKNRLRDIPTDGPIPSRNATKR